MTERIPEYLIQLKDVSRIYRSGSRSVEALKDINLKFLPESW